MATESIPQANIVVNSHTVGGLVPNTEAELIRHAKTGNITLELPWRIYYVESATVKGNLAELITSRVCASPFP